MLVLVNSTLVTVTRKKAVETAETIGDVGASENGKSGKYRKTNFAQVLCIRYPITF